MNKFNRFCVFDAKNCCESFIQRSMSDTTWNLSEKIKPGVKNALIALTTYYIIVCARFGVIS
jgi:hypothetical protein